MLHRSLDSLAGGDDAEQSANAARLALRHCSAAVYDG